MQLNKVLFCMLYAFTLIYSVSCKKSDTTETTPPPVNIEDTSGIVAKDTTLGDILRTPISRFDNLFNYNYKSNYIDVGKTGPLYMHYIDEGSKTGKVILLLHGNPAWVYNFREMIPVLVDSGYRVIAPDLIGFGKSDKPALRTAHTYDRHTEWITTFIEKMNLQNIHAHFQDWGGLIGLRVAIKSSSRFAKVAISNTSLPEGNNRNQALLTWINVSQTVNPYSGVIERSTFSELTTAEEAAYDAPFPDETYKSGPRQMPQNIPITTTDAEAIENQQLWVQLEQWQKPFLTIFAETDAISAGEQDNFKNRVPGANGQAHRIVPNTNHFIREDEPVLMSKYLIEFFK
jgi:haloalkane dehalogenase